MKHIICYWKMCIQFVYFNNAAQNDSYRLIIVNNRDEYYSRPTKAANFWDGNPDCISGLDAFPGRENGTWFAASKKGKFCGLLNILTPQGPNPNKAGRGHIVTDYISQPISADTYCEGLSKEASKYNLFNLCMVERDNDGKWGLHYFTNSTEHTTGNFTFRDGVYGFSNSVFERPYQKVKHGQNTFREIIETVGKTGSSDELKECIYNLMSDRTSTLPDPQLSIQADDGLQGDAIAQRSAIYVHSPQLNYGTRTTTILTVSADDTCDYTEKTMTEPINKDSPTWQTASFRFPLV